MESLFALMLKCWSYPGSNEAQISESTLEYHRNEWADFTVIHDSPSIGAGPDITVPQNLKGGGELSVKVCPGGLPFKWQLMFAFCLCSSMELKRFISPCRHP